VRGRLRICDVPNSTPTGVVTFAPTLSTLPPPDVELMENAPLRPPLTEPPPPETLEPV
jgi:hypothetical protein